MALIPRRDPPIFMTHQQLVFNGPNYPVLHSFVVAEAFLIFIGLSSFLILLIDYFLPIPSGADTIQISLLVVPAAVAGVYFYANRRLTTDFIITPSGIGIPGNFLPWSSLRHFHWLGQDVIERLLIINVPNSLIDSNDLVNVHVVRITFRPWHLRWKGINLSVPPEKTEQLQALLRDRGLPQHPNSGPEIRL